MVPWSMIPDGQCQWNEVVGGGSVYVTHVILVSPRQVHVPIQRDRDMNPGLTIVLGIIRLITLYLHIM